MLRLRPAHLGGARRGKPQTRAAQMRSERPSMLRSTACGHDKGRVPMDTRSWYVLVTSSSRENVFAMLGPYATREIAERKARNSRVVHYRVELVTSTPN